MKVAVLTFHKCINYGSYWQARCMVEALLRRGHQAELLDHDCRDVRRAEVRCALQPKLPERTPRRELATYAQKTRQFIRAIADLPLSRRFSLDEPEGAGDYDAIIIGSDEVWNFRHPWYGSKPIFFGEGLRTKRLVSYAASFGNHSAWDGIHPAWAGKLDRFSAISVRDENSRCLVRRGTMRESELVLDPCLLYPEPARCAWRPSERYAIIYGHGFPAWFKRLARDWSRASKVRLVSIGYSNDFAEHQRIAIGPLEFARMMAGASAVITNFFHGCVFSLLNGKPFATVPSDYRSIKIPDLAASLGTSHRILDEGSGRDDFARLMETPIEVHVQRRIAELKSRSRAFLDEALA